MKSIENLEWRYAVKKFDDQKNPRGTKNKHLKTSF